MNTNKEQAGAGGEAAEDGKVPEAEAKKEVVSPVVRLDKDNFEEKIKTGVAFIKFYAPWCGFCQDLAPVWDELAKKFESDGKVKIAKLDCTEAQSVCQENEVKGYPTLSYFR